MSLSLSLRFAAVALLSALLAGCAMGDGSQDLLAEVEEAPRPTFELEGRSGGEYTFRFADSAGEALLHSKRYQSRVGALGGVASVLDNGGLEHRYDVATTETGGYRVELFAKNGVVVAKTRAYASAGEAEARIPEITSAIAEYMEFRYEASGPRVHVYEEPAGTFRFDIYAQGDDPLLSSQSYTSEGAALNGAVSALDHGSAPGSYGISEEGGAHYLELSARNGRTLAESARFDTRSEAEDVLEDALAWLPRLRVL